jgi:general secretion pathway protein E
LAQRLVRTLCVHCKQPKKADHTLIDDLHLRHWQTHSEIVLHKPVGCQQCNGTGYKGRLAILELLVMTDTIRKQIMQHEEAYKIHKLAIEEGMITMYDDGVIKALQGLTTLEEVMRVTNEA